MPIRSRRVTNLSRRCLDVALLAAAADPGRPAPVRLLLADHVAPTDPAGGAAAAVSRRNTAL
ncbi:hypothetical protein [Micromonospora sp. NPDC092111]|uniref:hypothetical protein n=1 Tax=Micromonospora sp. NPDC092111 TaxID=3364289 RepID=UPI0038282230